MKRLSFTLMCILIIGGSPVLAKNDKNSPDDETKQTIGFLECSDQQIAKYNQTIDKWQCASDTNEDTLADLACQENQIARYNGNEWECADFEVSEPEPTQYVVVQGDNFAPFDIDGGSAPAGFSTAIFNAVCDANTQMDCTILLDSNYGNCVTTDGTPGPHLLGDTVVGCLSWVNTASRRSDGFVFTNAYADTGDNTEIWSLDSNFDSSRTLAYLEGFISTPACAADNGFDYQAHQPELTNQDAIDALEPGTDVMLPAGIGSPELFPEPELVNKIATFGCGDGFAVITFPPGMFLETFRFIEDFNCGLSLIAAKGTYDDICVQSFGELFPDCLDSSTEIPLPTASCLKKSEAGT